MEEIIQWTVDNATLITAIATAVLAFVTFYYALEMRRVRIESAKPIFTLRPGFPVGEEPMELYLINNGGVAQDVLIDVIINGVIKHQYHVASIPNDGNVKLNVSLDECKKNQEKIDVKLKYHTLYEWFKNFDWFKTEKTISLDFKNLAKNKYEEKYYYTSIENKLLTISNKLTQLHNDAEFGKFKSDNITVYPTEKPTRANRNKKT